MKGCYGIFIHYLRVLALFGAPLMFVAAAMSDQWGALWPYCPADPRLTMMQLREAA